MIAHAMTNAVAIAILFNVWIPFAAVTAVVVWQRRAVLEALRRFAADWRADQSKPGLWFGVVVLVVVIAVTMIAMSQPGGMTGLLATGSIGFLVTVVNIVREKRT